MFAASPGQRFFKRWLKHMDATKTCSCAPIRTFGTTHVAHGDGQVDQLLNVLVILGHPRVDRLCGALAEPAVKVAGLPAWSCAGYGEQGSECTCLHRAASSRPADLRSAGASIELLLDGVHWRRYSGAASCARTFALTGASLPSVGLQQGAWNNGRGRPARAELLASSRRSKPMPFGIQDRQSRANVR